VSGKLRRVRIRLTPPVVALRIAVRLGPGKTVATLIVDSGLRYLSTDVFRSPA